MSNVLQQTIDHGKKMMSKWRDDFSSRGIPQLTDLDKRAFEVITTIISRNLHAVAVAPEKDIVRLLKMYQSDYKYCFMYIQSACMVALLDNPDNEPRPGTEEMERRILVSASLFATAAFNDGPSYLPDGAELTPETLLQLVKTIPHYFDGLANCDKDSDKDNDKEAKAAQKRKRKRAAQKARKKNRSRDKEEPREEEDGGGYCSCCLTEKSDMVFLPCRHVCTCKKCFTQMVKTSGKGKVKCPMCRSIVKESFKVSIS